MYSEKLRKWYHLVNEWLIEKFIFVEICLVDNVTLFRGISS